MVILAVVDAILIALAVGTFAMLVMFPPSLDITAIGPSGRAAVEPRSRRPRAHREPPSRGPSSSC